MYIIRVIRIVCFSVPSNVSNYLILDNSIKTYNYIIYNYLIIISDINLIFKK